MEKLADQFEGTTVSKPMKVSIGEHWIIVHCNYNISDMVHMYKAKQIFKNILPLCIGGLKKPPGCTW